MAFTARGPARGRPGSFVGVSLNTSGFDRISQEVSGEALLSVLLPIAERVEAEAEQIVPVRTGDLRSSIRVESESSDYSARAAVAAGGIPGEATGKVVNHAAPVEFGTATREAKPYLRPAWDLVSADAREQIATGIANLFGKINV